MKEKQEKLKGFHDLSGNPSSQSSKGTGPSKAGAFGIHHKAFICTVCGTCLSTCKKGVFRKLASVRSIAITAERCIGCFNCVEKCPVKAISVYRVKSQSMPPR